MVNPTPTESDTRTEEYQANFLWPHEHGTIEEAGYEFANGQTEAYREIWWRILKERIKASA